MGIGREFYIYNEELWYLSEDGTNKPLTERDEELIGQLLQRIIDDYPEAYKALSEKYEKSSANVRYYQYLIVRCFCKCNFGTLDGTKMDIDPKGRFNFEKVSCPCRNECKFEGIVCMPKFNTKLSNAEERVMRALYDGCSNEEIADKLYLSVNTVKNHIKSAYRRLGVNDRGEFIKLASEKNFFS